MSASETFEKHHPSPAMPTCETDVLASALRALAAVLIEQTDNSKAQFEWFRSHLHCATLNDLQLTEGRIMSAIADFAAKQKAFNDRQAAAIDSLGASVTGIQGDVKHLNDVITQLQNNPGPITHDDQVLLDDLETSGAALSTRLEGVATDLKAVDDATPPVVP